MKLVEKFLIFKQAAWQIIVANPPPHPPSPGYGVASVDGYGLLVPPCSIAYRRMVQGLWCRVALERNEFSAPMSSVGLCRLVSVRTLCLAKAPEDWRNPRPAAPESSGSFAYRRIPVADVDWNGQTWTATDETWTESRCARLAPHQFEHLRSFTGQVAFVIVPTFVGWQRRCSSFPVADNFAGNNRLAKAPPVSIDFVQQAK